MIALQFLFLAAFLVLLLAAGLARWRSRRRRGRVELARTLGVNYAGQDRFKLAERLADASLQIARLPALRVDDVFYATRSQVRRYVAAVSGLAGASEGRRRRLVVHAVERGGAFELVSIRNVSSDQDALSAVRSVFESEASDVDSESSGDG